MKKIAVMFAFVLLASAAFAQMTKSEAQAFLERNPLSKFKYLYIWGEYASNDQGEVIKTYYRYDAAVSKLTAGENGFHFYQTSTEGNTETYLPYLYIVEIFAGADKISISLVK
ncbi:MAG TPA: hypothetical protein VHS96_08160 [Bacteroidia bacterium]|nr:hypothetical protein [Bacteroidia bacterium]